MHKRIMIVAGEASGDLHGGNLVNEALRLHPDLQFFGIGGKKMRAAGVDTIVDAAEMAVVGLVEVVAHFDVIFRAFTKLKHILKENPPDLLILIDYPDFNLRLAKVAKASGVPVLYYISPQVWAWRAGRVKKIARLVDHMAVVFPFEAPFYQKEGVPVTFVGHPLLDVVRPEMSREEAQRAFGLDPALPVVGLFPGSRRSELKMLLRTILESAALLKERLPSVQFILPLASSLTRDDLAPYLRDVTFPVTVVEGQGYDVMQVCDTAITVSGTVTLELALMGIPMTIIYRMSPLTYAVAKRLVQVDHAGLCNIVAGERVVRELIQHDATPEKIAEETERLLNDREYVRVISTKLGQIRGRLGSGGCSANVARLALDMLSLQPELP